MGYRKEAVHGGGGPTCLAVRQPASLLVTLKVVSVWVSTIPAGSNTERCTRAANSPADEGKRPTKLAAVVQPLRPARRRCSLGKTP